MLRFTQYNFFGFPLYRNYETQISNYNVLNQFTIHGKICAQKMDNFRKKLKQKLLKNIPPIR